VGGTGVRCAQGNNKASARQKKKDFRKRPRARVRPKDGRGDEKAGTSGQRRGNVCGVPRARVEGFFQKEAGEETRRRQEQASGRGVGFAEHARQGKGTICEERERGALHCRALRSDGWGGARGAIRPLPR
jgi:hypothetical protein